MTNAIIKVVDSSQYYTPEEFESRLRTPRFTEDEIVKKVEQQRLHKQHAEYEEALTKRLAAMTERVLIDYAVERNDDGTWDASRYYKVVPQKNLGIYHPSCEWRRNTWFSRNNNYDYVWHKDIQEWFDENGIEAQIHFNKFLHQEKVAYPPLPDKKSKRFRKSEIKVNVVSFDSFESATHFKLRWM